MTRRTKKRQLRDSHGLRNKLDSMGRDNTTKRGPKGELTPHELRVNHRHAKWCKESGYPYKPEHILDDVTYEALCYFQPKPVVISEASKASRDWVKRNASNL